MSKLFILVSALFLWSCNQQPAPQPTPTKNSQKWVLDGFEKVDSLNPILRPEASFSFECPLNQEQVAWEARNVLNPTAVVRDDTVYMLYRAQDLSGTSRIGLATSTDGLRFQKKSTPVLYPQMDSMYIYEWNYKKRASSTMEPKERCTDCFDGIEDPRIVERPEGGYIMTYTAYDGKTARLAVASSDNLLDWTKHGLAFKHEKYQDMWSKAGAILVEQQGSSMVAKQIAGKYWMYFGDTNIFLATSDDLINWQICENEENQKMIAVLHPRKGYFDSRLVEPGPYALYTERGILLIYNASNAANFNDPQLPKFTYAAGQALFDKTDPYRLVDRTNGYFIHPDKDYEKIGEVNEVCFVEGLVNYKSSWFLYYGTADSKIAVAVTLTE